MVVSHEIGSYRLLMISGYGGAGGTQIGFIYLNDMSGKYLGYVGIIRAGAALPPNVQHSNGILNIYFHESQLVAMLDTLRNEKPLFVRFHTTLKWGSIGTGNEPVGEAEIPAP